VQTAKAIKEKAPAPAERVHAGKMSVNADSCQWPFEATRLWPSQSPRWWPRATTPRWPG